MEIQGIHIADSVPYIPAAEALAGIARFYDEENGKLFQEQYGIQDSDLPPEFDPTMLESTQHGYFYDSEKIESGVTGTLNRGIIFSECLLYAFFENSVLHASFEKYDTNLDYFLTSFIVSIDKFNINSILDILADGNDLLASGYSISKNVCSYTGKQSVESKLKTMCENGIRQNDYCLSLNLSGTHVVEEDSSIRYTYLPENPVLCYVKELTEEEITLTYIPDLHPYPEMLLLWESLDNREMVRDILSSKKETYTQTIPISEISLEYYSNFNESTILSPLNSVHYVQAKVWIGDSNKFDPHGPVLEDILPESIVLYTALAQNGYYVPKDVELPWYASKIDYVPPKEYNNFIESGIDTSDSEEQF
jgi:hypothetical protein